MYAASYVVGGTWLAMLLFFGTSAQAETRAVYESEELIAHRAEIRRLHAAVRVGDPDAVEAVLASGVDVNDTAALELAILMDRDDIVDLLIERGADINRPGLGGDLPLTVAARRGRPELMQRLIDRGADINQRDRRGMTALDHAQRQGRPEAAEFLRHRGARDRTEPR